MQNLNESWNISTHIGREKVDKLEAGKTLVGGSRSVYAISLEAIEEDLWKCYKAERGEDLRHRQSMGRRP